MNSLMLGFNAIEKPLRLLADERLTHQHVIGSSGSGKSKFLEQMIRGDLRAGQGFCLIDPHGTLYEDVLRFCAFETRRNKITLLNLSEPEEIVGFNFFTKDSEGDTSVQVDNLIEATLHAWDAKNSDSTPTLERILKLIYTTVLDADLTLPQVAALLDFKNSKIRNDLIAKIENDLIRREWQEISDLPRARDFRDEILSAKNRMFRFLTSQTLMRFLGVKGKTIDLHEAMNQGQIVLVNLARSPYLSAENARVFGSLLVNQFFQAALKRKKDIYGQKPKPYYLYLDEFQNFVSLDLCNMLDEVRKFGLFLILSHQRFGQLNEEIEDAILANCRIKTVFGGLRTEDARRMAEELFIGKVDPMKVKVAIYQTKFYPRYGRDQVYGKSHSSGGSSGMTTGEGSGRSNGLMSSSIRSETTLPPGEGFFTGADWFQPGTNVLSQSETFSEGISGGESYSSFSSESSSESWSDSESVADIPIFFPVPFQELSSTQYYTVEEQLFELTQALKLTAQRRCFIQLPGQETQPLLVPFIDDFYISEKNLNWYKKVLAEKAGSLTKDEADLLISQSVQDLLQLEDRPAAYLEAGLPEEEKPTADNPSLKPPDEKPKKKKTIFDKIKADNPDLDI